MIKLDIVNVMTGAMFVGRALDRPGHEMVELLYLDNRGFSVIKDFIAHQTFGKTELTDEEYNSPVLLEHYSRLQAYLRNGIQSAVMDIAQSYRDDLKHSIECCNREAKARIDEMNRPNPAGSVAELSEKLGVSKGEIRRMRAAGTLDQFIEDNLKK